MATVVIDPVTRIEGHLRIEAETGAGNVVTRASSSGTMMRGIEIILRGRDPRDAWAFTQRICGVCTVVHSLTSIRAVENALGWTIPTNARHIRNLMMGAQMVQDQVTHFYQLTSMDWIDIVSATTADATATSNLQKCQSDWPNNSPAYFEAVKQKLIGFVSTGQLGLFANGYWGHPSYKLPPEMNLMLFAHWLEALDWQRKVLKVHGVFGGRNPHPNFVVGGVPCTLSNAPVANTKGEKTVAVDPAALAVVQACITDMRNFVDKVLRKDILAMARFYKDWFKRGEGLGNFLSFGDYPNDNSHQSTDLFVPRGALLGRDLSTIHAVDLNDASQVQEFVASSWYDYTAGKSAGLHPYDGETTPAYTGPQAAYASLDVTRPYSWDKTPRWKGKPMEVGPLARVLLMYAKGNASTRDKVNQALAELKLPISALYSTMGRIVAQSIDTHVIADQMQVWLDALKANIARGDLATHDPQFFNPSSWPDVPVKGVGYTEAPRGALGHWVSFEKTPDGMGGRILNYQCVVPTTWNASPRDPAGQSSAYEAALVGHALAVPEQPLELLRTIHSFNPCMACAVHLIDGKGGDALRVKVC
jgi:hydrogenase large subunit